MLGLRTSRATFLSVAAVFFTILFAPIDARSQGLPMGELIEGQWAEGRDLDPFGKRPVQLWLPEGTLIFDVQKTDRLSGSSSKKYRSVRTYHGYPVTLQLFPRRGVSRYRRIKSRNSNPRFRLIHSVYCPGETSPLIPNGGSCNHGTPTGEGWIFDLSNEGEDTPLGPRFTATAHPDDDTQNELGPQAAKVLSFPIYQRDLDKFEKTGVLFRIDREHPLSSFNFVGSDFFPCNTELTSEFKEEKVTSAFAKAELEAEFGIWTWFKTKVSGGASYEDKGSEILGLKTKVDSSKSSVFQQWGVLQDSASDERLPFFVEKQFECQQGVGSTKPGDRILSVEVSFWNSEFDKNDVYEFNDHSKWVTMRDEIYERHQRPIFFSVNDSDKQASIIRKIQNENPKLSYNQAVFIFTQLNNGCSFNDRTECDKLVQIRQTQD
ncbi:MAG: hypothetical protein ACFB03_22620 [Paracoccaceae bacterium]